MDRQEGQRDTHTEDEREEGKTSLPEEAEREGDRQTRTKRKRQRLVEHPKGIPEEQGPGKNRSHDRDPALQSTDAFQNPASGFCPRKSY